MEKLFHLEAIHETQHHAPMLASPQRPAVWSRPAVEDNLFGNQEDVSANAVGNQFRRSAGQ